MSTALKHDTLNHHEAQNVKQEFHTTPLSRRLRRRHEEVIFFETSKDRRKSEVANGVRGTRRNFPDAARDRGASGDFIDSPRFAGMGILPSSFAMLADGQGLKVPVVLVTKTRLFPRASGITATQLTTSYGVRAGRWITAITGCGHLAGTIDPRKQNHALAFHAGFRFGTPGI